jgi:hypothetical protein
MMQFFMVISSHHLNSQSFGAKFSTRRKFPTSDDYETEIGTGQNKTVE